MARLPILVALAVVSAIAGIAPVPASGSISTLAVIEDCRERAVVVPGVEELVRERVPEQFELVRDPLGRPLLIVDGARCERIAAGGKTAPSSFVVFAAMIKSPDGGGCQSRWPLVGDLKGDLIPLCNFYGLLSAHSNGAVVRATKAEVPDGPIFHVPNLDFEQGAFDLTRLGSQFRFTASPPIPSPFELRGIVRDGPVQHPLTMSFWVAASSGVHRIRFDGDRVAIGQLEARLHVTPGSEMAALLGGENPRPLMGVALRYSYGEITHESFSP
jgi:hypothetical protein